MTLRMGVAFVLCAFGVLSVAGVASANAQKIDMDDVRRMARQPVSKILDGSPVRPITDANYDEIILKRIRPKVVVFYAEDDENSRRLAAMMRLIAFRFENKLGFYAYRVADTAKAARAKMDGLKRRYSLDKLPGTFFYDTDKGRVELEKEEYGVPRLREYRRPSLFFFKRYYRTISDHIVKHVLD